MSIKSFFKSLKGIFWFNTDTDELVRRDTSSADEHDVFFVARDVPGCEGELKELRSWVHSNFEEPHIKLNDPESKEAYMDLALDVETRGGDFHLFYYENDELVLRGDRGVVMEVKGPISEELELEFERV